MPFLLHLAARLEKRDLVLIDGPVKALLAYCLGLENPFPLAAVGELTVPQIAILQRYLHDEGSLTLCWDYDPETYGTAKEKTLRTLKLLKEVDFPVYAVDPQLLAGNGKAKGKVSIDEFILGQGGGEKGVHEFRKILERRRAEVRPQTAVPLDRAWPEFEVPSGSGGAPAGFLGSMLGAAEEFGQRIAQGFLKALPPGVTRGLLRPPGEEPEELPGEIPQLPAAPLTPPPAFSVERLEEENRKISWRKLSGWLAVDRMGVSFDPGELALVGSRPGHGKTSFLIGLLVEWLSQIDQSDSGEIFLFYAMEESEVRLYHRLLSLLTAWENRGWTPNQVRDYFRDPEPFQDVSRWPDRESLDRSRECLRRWEERLHIIYPPVWTITEMQAHARGLAEQHQLGAIFVDQLQHVPPPRRRGERRDLQVSSVAGRLKALAVELSCPVVAAAQIGRQALRSARKIPRDRSFQDEDVQEVIRLRRPQLHHLKGGGKR